MTDITVVVETGFSISSSSLNVNATLSLDLSGSKANMGYTNFQWYRNGTSLGAGATSSTYNVTIPGDYYITATSPKCNSKISDTITIYDACNSSYTSNVNLCYNPVTFNLPSGFNYDWYVAEENITTYPATNVASYNYYKSGNNIYLDKNDFSSNMGSFYVYYVAKLGSTPICTSNTFQVKIDDIMPQVSSSSSVLSHNLTSGAYQIGYSNYQWYKYGQSIAGATSSRYTATSSGYYYFSATSATCGNLISDTFSYYASNTQCSQVNASYLSCDTSYNLSYTPASGYITHWYHCDINGNNATALNGGVPINALTVYSSNPQMNSQEYYFYVCIDSFSQAACTSAVITIEYEPLLSIVSDNNTPPAYNLQTNSGLINYTTFQWYDQNGIISGATTSNYNPPKSGIYYLIAYSPSCGSRRSNDISYTPNNTQCNATPATHHTCDTAYDLIFNPAIGYEVNWYACDSLGANGSALNSGTPTDTIRVRPSLNSTTQGYYFYYICTDIFTQATCTSAVITVVFEKNLTITASSNVLPAILSANPYSNNIAYNSYQWYRNGRRIPNANSATYYANLPGQYNLRSNSVCGNSESNDIAFACSTATTSTTLNNYTFPAGN